MDELFAALQPAWPILVFLGMAILWLGRLESAVKNHIEKLRQLPAMWKRIDDMGKDVDVLKAQSAVFADIMSPEKLEKLYRELGGMQKDIEWLKDDQKEQ